MKLGETKPEELEALYRKHNMVPVVREASNTGRSCCGLGVLAKEVGIVIGTDKPAVAEFCQKFSATQKDTGFFGYGFDLGMAGRSPGGSPDALPGHPDYRCPEFVAGCMAGRHCAKVFGTSV